MKESTNLPLGIALIPAKEGIEQVVELNQRIHDRYPSAFRLHSAGNLLPHVSLFQGQFSPNDLVATKKISASLAQRYNQKILAQPLGIRIWADRIFFLDLEKDESGLTWLHEGVFISLNPLRVEEAGSADPQLFTGISDAEQDSFERYRYPFAGAAFRPHFTLGRSEQIDGDEVILATELEYALPASPFSFDRLVLFEVGQFGRLESLVAEHELR